MMNMNMFLAYVVGQMSKRPNWQHTTRQQRENFHNFSWVVRTLHCSKLKVQWNGYQEDG
jgi:hypothetical protein